MLLVYWVWKAQLSCSVQMKPWDGSIIDINATCNELGPKCLQLLGMHVLSDVIRCHTLSTKCKVAALTVIKAGNFSNLFDTLGEEGVSPETVRQTGLQFFAALYFQPSTVTMSEAKHRIYMRKKENTSWPCLRQMAIWTFMSCEDISNRNCGWLLTNKVLQIWASPSLGGRYRMGSHDLLSRQL